jgi:hypothetical protein
MSKGPFRRQKSFRRLSPPYQAKTLERPNGYFTSRKTDRQIPFWTTLEYKAMALFECDPDVLGFVERPEQVMLREGPNWLGYIPSFEIKLDSLDVVVELSWTGRPKGPKQEWAAKLIRAHYASVGVHFVELGYVDICARPRAKNARLLLRYLPVTPTAQEIARIRDLIADGPAQFMDVVATTGKSPALPLAMARRGEVTLTGPGEIGTGTVISMVDRRVRR